MVVYRIIFPNSKCYIGITKNLATRKRGHKYAAFTAKLNNPIQSAIRKYGWDNLVWKIL